MGEFFPELDLSRINIRTRIPLYVRITVPDVTGYKNPRRLNTIHIRRSRYSQETTEGLALIAHELQHVVQATREGLHRFVSNYVRDNMANGYGSSAYEADAWTQEYLVRAELLNLYGGSNPCP